MENIVTSSHQAAKPDGLASSSSIDLFPYSQLQQIGFFILFFFPALALCIVILRVYTRFRSKQFGWDDGLICLAMMFSMAETGASYMGMRHAYLGVHVYDIPPTADLSQGMFWNYVIQTLYNPILALVKSSVLLFMLQLGGHRRSIRYSIHALNAFNIGLMFAVFVTVIFQCNPVSYFWQQVSDPTMKGTCINTGAFYTSTAGLTILTDLLVLALPFWIFIGLKMAMRIKIALMAVFLLGGVVTIIGILRLRWIIETSFYPPGPDPTYDISFTYSAVETNLAIATASAPALRALLVKWFPRFFATLSGSSRKYRQDNTPDANTYGSTVPRATKPNTKNVYSQYGSSSFAMKTLGGRGAGVHHLRETSPASSEEEIMTYNGIIRTTEVNVEYGKSRPSEGTNESHKSYE